jgi:nitrite reductase/ring-hydroxylating ferredoxin subunit
MEGGRWHPVCGQSEIGAGAMLSIEIGEHQIAVYNVDGEIFATDNVCSHGMALLTDGFLDGDTVECPLHGGCFNVKTGKALCEPAEEDVRVYQTRMVDERLEVFVEN